MNYQELIQKTGVVSIGIVKSVNEYVSTKGRSYWSVDLECKGSKFPINVGLPQGYPLSGLKEFELIKLSLAVVPTFDLKGRRLVALLDD